MSLHRQAVAHAVETLLATLQIWQEASTGTPESATVRRDTKRQLHTLAKYLDSVKDKP